jgi:hypothetical protein
LAADRYIMCGEKSKNHFMSFRQSLGSPKAALKFWEKSNKDYMMR